MSDSKADQRYVGIDKEIDGGMIIRDARVFGPIPGTGTCDGRLPHGLEALWRKAQVESGELGCQVGRLSEALRERFTRIQNEAVGRARTADPDPELFDDSEARGCRPPAVFQCS